MIKSNKEELVEFYDLYLEETNRLLGLTEFSEHFSHIIDGLVRQAYFLGVEDGKAEVE